MVEFLTNQLPSWHGRWLPLAVVVAFFLLSGFEHQELFEKAEAGDRFAQYKLGYYFYKRGTLEYDPEKAVHWFIKAAENGDLLSLVVMSRFYRDGQFVDKDAEKASLYRKRVIDAAGKKEPTTEFPTKEDYIADFFLPWGRDWKDADYKEELIWRRKAAEKGSSFSQWRMGNFTEFGKGVKEDWKLALEWYRKAGIGGLKLGQKSFCELVARVDYFYQGDLQFNQWCK